MSKFPERDGATERLSPQSALTMLIIVGVCYMINAMDRIVFSILLPNVTGDYGFSLEQGGLLATVFTLGLGLSGVPTGLAMDRFSRKTVILLGMFVYSVLTIATRSRSVSTTWRAIGCCPGWARECRTQPPSPPSASTSTGVVRWP
jgi:MFS family permease